MLSLHNVDLLGCRFGIFLRFRLNFCTVVLVSVKGGCEELPEWVFLFRERGKVCKNIPHHVDEKKSIKICCSIAELDFQEKLYLIQAGLPATMLKNPTAFHDFMAPIEPSTSELRISWFSLPQVSETWLQRWGAMRNIYRFNGGVFWFELGLNKVRYRCWKESFGDFFSRFSHSFHFCLNFILFQGVKSFRVPSIFR